MFYKTASFSLAFSLIILSIIDTSSPSMAYMILVSLDVRENISALLSLDQKRALTKMAKSLHWVNWRLRLLSHVISKHNIEVK